MKNKRGQATTELAIMGSIVLMLLAYLLQQGYFYNARQALDMYAFRTALQMSREQQRGISLTVSRDVIAPSLFSGLSRQRLMASSSVEINPYMVYIPGEGTPQDIGTYQLLQLDEAMIRNGQFIEIPPTKAKIKPEDEDSKWQWIGSAISGIDSQIIKPGDPKPAPTNTYNYDYRTSIQENSQAKTITKTLESQDRIERGVTFEERDKTIEDYNKNSTDSVMEDIEEATIPDDVNFILSETVQRQKSTTTPH